MENMRLNALALHLEVDVNELSISSYDEQNVEYGSKEYLVVTDEEANKLWDESLNHYLDEIILPELPEHARNYFDNDAWKRDARFDGRGHALSTYDSNEEEITIYGWENNKEDDMYTDTNNEPEGFWSNGEEETFYIFRTN